MRDGINIWQLEDVLKCTKQCATNIGNQWVPVRPYGWTNWQTKFRAIKLILSEKADVVIWPKGQ